MNKALWVQSINFEQRIAILSDNSVVPITNFFGESGEQDSHEGAIAFVCGEGEMWFSYPVDDFTEVTMQ